MRKTLFSILLLLVLSFSASAQSVIKYHTTFKSSRTTPGEWSEPKPFDVLTVVNIKDMSVTLYGNRSLRYDVLRTEAKKTDSDGDRAFVLHSVDTDGDATTITFLKRANGIMQLYVVYPRFAFCYELVQVATDEQD